MAEVKTSAPQEQELSMDEILSSIRNIITEDQESRPEEKRTFTEDATTNPSGARQMGDLPKFDSDGGFQLPDFYQEKKNKTQAVASPKRDEVFPDEGFKQHFSNETSFKEKQAPYFNQAEFSREAHASVGDNISSALKGIVESYANKKVQQSVVSESPQADTSNLGFAGSSKLNDMINTMIEKIVVIRIEDWLHQNLSGILEKVILRELERVLTQLKI